MFQFQHQFLRDAGWGKLPVECERALVRMRFVSKKTSVGVQVITSKGLPLEADISSSIAPQSAIVISFDK